MNQQKGKIIIAACDDEINSLEFYNSEPVYEKIGRCLNMKNPFEKIHSYEFMKKVLVILLLFALSLFFAGCSKKDKDKFTVTEHYQNVEKTLYCEELPVMVSVERDILYWMTLSDTEGTLYSYETATDEIHKITSIDITGQVFSSFTVNEQGIPVLSESIPDGTVLIGDEQVFSRTGNDLLLYEKKTDVTEPVISWSRYGIHSSTVYGYHRYGENGFYVATGEFKDGNINLSIQLFEPTSEATEIDNRTEIKLAVFNNAFFLEDMIFAYNSQSSQYYVTIQDYCVDEMSIEDGLTKLGAEIAGGGGPDIIDLEYLNVYDLMNQGYLENLMPYLEQEETIDRKDYFESVLMGYQLDDFLYMIPYAYTMVVYVGNQDIIGDRTSILLADIYELMEKNASLESVYYLSKEQTLLFLSLMSMHEYVNLTEKTCDFNSEKFQKLLQFIQDRDQQIEHNESRSELVNEGKVLLNFSPMFGISMYEYNMSSYENPVIVGSVDSDEGDISASAFGLRGGITSFSKNKEGAWDFLRFCLLEEQQNMIANSSNARLGICYPVHRESLKQSIETADMSAEMMQMMLELHDRVVVNSGMDDNIWNIIEEETAYYFDHQKSLEEVTEIIQNRVSLYLSERK